MEVNDRVQEVITKYYQGNKRAFAQAIDVSPTVVENIVGKRQGKPSFDVLHKMYANANINPTWIVGGVGPIYMNKQESSEQSSSSSARSGDVEAFLSHMAGKDETIMKQAKEIGRLEAEVELITAERDAAIAAAERARTNMTA